MRPTGGAAILDRDPNEHVLDARLGVLHEDIEVPIAIEDARVEEFVFTVVACALLVACTQRVIREAGLRILVEILHVGMRGRAIQVEAVVLDVFAVAAFGVGQPEEPFFQEGIAPVPERDCEADQLLTIADAGEPVVAPAVGPGAGVVVRKVLPGVSVSGVVLPHRAPRAFAQVRTPPFPVEPSRASFFQAGLFVRHLAPASGTSVTSDRDARSGFGETRRVTHLVVIPGRD
jgi:hypothetical protein